MPNSGKKVMTGFCRAGPAAEKILAKEKGVQPTTPLVGIAEFLAPS
jgi:hypothetical protein